MDRAGRARHRSATSTARPTPMCWVLEKFIRPNVPLINGLLLGGGIGITLYGTHCVAGEGYKAAMPQVGIGFLPDIGGTYFLSRLENHFGLYLALTGRAIGPADAYRLRLITHYIPAAPFPRHQGRGERQSSDRPAARRASPRSRRRRARKTDACDPPHLRSRRRSRRSWTVSMRSRARTKPGRKATAAEIRKKSPTSLKIAFAQMRRGKALSLAEALQLEFRLASQLVALPRLCARASRRGSSARAREPRWQPATLAEVDDAEIERLFATAPDGRACNLKTTPGLELRSRISTSNLNLMMVFHAILSVLD